MVEYGWGLKLFEKSENIRVGAFLWGYTSGFVAGYGGSVRWRGTWGGTYSEISHSAWEVLTVPFIDPLKDTPLDRRSDCREPLRDTEIGSVGMKLAS